MNVTKKHNFRHNSLAMTIYIKMFHLFKHTKVFVTSSKNRTIDSARSFAEGAFPDETISLGAPNDRFLRVRI